MNKQDRYDDLDNFISSLKLLKSELISKDLIEEIDFLLYNTNFWREKDELEKELAQENELELSEREKEFRRMQGFR